MFSECTFLIIRATILSLIEQRISNNTYLRACILHVERVLLEILTRSQLVKKFPAYYWTRRFITIFTSARHLSLSSASSFQSITPHPTSWISILILSSHLCLGISNNKDNTFCCYIWHCYSLRFNAWLSWKNKKCHSGTLLFWRRRKDASPKRR